MMMMIDILSHTWDRWLMEQMKHPINTGMNQIRTCNLEIWTAGLYQAYYRSILNVWSAML